MVHGQARTSDMLLIGRPLSTLAMVPSSPFGSLNCFSAAATEAAQSALCASSQVSAGLGAAGAAAARTAAGFADPFGLPSWRRTAAAADAVPSTIASPSANSTRLRGRCLLGARDAIG